MTAERKKASKPKADENAPLQRVRIDSVRLEHIMHLRGYTNKRLAEETGKHYNTITRMKKVQSTKLSEIAELCDVLQCHPFDLIVAEGFPEPFSLAPASL